MSTPSTYNEAIALLSTLWGDTGFGEFRILGDKGALKPLWLTLPLRLDHLAPALDWAYRRNAEGYNAYFGVHPRNQRRGRNEDVERYSCLVADLDNPDVSWPLYTRLAAAGCPASVCVRTPRGMHLYWLLNAPESTSGITRTRMQLLQRAIKSDAVHDPARILRLPGATCHKTDAGLAVYVAWIAPDIKYSSEEIASKVKELWPTVEVEDTTTDESQMSALVLASPIETDLIAKFSYAYPKGGRSEKCIAFMYLAVLHGWSMDQIQQTLLSLPIGGHYTDRGRNGESSFIYDYEKTYRNVNYELQSSLKVIIESVTLVTNPDNTRKLKLRLKPYSHRYALNVGFNSWIGIPDEYNQVFTPRWQAFLSSVNATNYTEDQLMSNLQGRQLRVLFHDDSNTVSRFLPDVL